MGKTVQLIKEWEDVEGKVQERLVRVEHDAQMYYGQNRGKQKT